MKKINPPIGSIKKLTEEFKVTRTTVNQALAYYSNSETAIQIRERAKELLVKEIKDIKQFESTLKH